MFDTYYNYFQYSTSDYTVGDSNISIDWGNSVIQIPRAGLTLIQSSPTEIRELNLNTFRLLLKNFEDDSEGINFLTTHNHNPVVSVGGVQLARVLEILEPYTVTFEDGQYAVNLVGANSNVGDRVNVNNASVRSANSAGLIQTREIEHSSFNGVVTVDISSIYSGEAYPNGTQKQPVNNLVDGKSIAVLRGFSEFVVIGDITVSSGSYDSYIFRGESRNKSTITIDSSANVLNCEFYDATITGTLDGGTVLKDCTVLNLTYVDGEIEDCMLGSGVITLFDDAHIINCYSGVLGTNTPIINMGGSGASLGLRNYNGGIKITNKTGVDDVSIDLNSGKVIIDSTVTNGTIVVRGIGELEDNSTGGALVISHYLTNPFSVRRDMQQMTESLRPHHQNKGDVYYWDPYGGNDSRDGISKKTAVKTFAQAHTLATDFNHDVIYITSSAPGPYDITENISITKNWVFVRGPGFNAKLKPTTVLSGSKAAIEINAEGVSLSGFHLDLINCSDPDSIGIKKTGKYFYLHDVIIKRANKQGLLSINGHDEIIENCMIAYCETDGIEITNTTGVEAEDIGIRECHIDSNGGNGINLSGSLIHEVMIKDHTMLHGSGGYGINIGSGAEQTYISGDLDFVNNTIGKVNDLGIATFFESAEELEETVNAIWDEPMSSHTVSGSFGEYIKGKVLTVAKFLGLK